MSLLDRYPLCHTKKQPGHQPENWRALQVAETAHGSVGTSSGTSGRCSCRNFSTCITTPLHPQVLHVVMDRSGTSVRSTRKRRGAKRLAVAAAANRVGEGTAVSQQPSVAAAAEFRNGPPRSTVYRMAVLKRVYVCSCGSCCASALRVSGTCTSLPERVSFSALQVGPLCILNGQLQHMKKLKHKAFVTAVFSFSIMMGW